MAKKPTEKQKISLWQQRREANYLASFELSGARLELGATQPGLPYLKHLHRELFHELLDDAGELRQVDVVLGETPGCHFEYIEKEGNALMRALEEENGLADLPIDKFVARLAWYYCELTVLHPFHRGNGRALRLFFEHLVFHAGYDIQWRRTDSESWQAANQASWESNLDPLIAEFSKVVSERDENT